MVDDVPEFLGVGNNHAFEEMYRLRGKTTSRNLNRSDLKRTYYTTGCKLYLMRVSQDAGLNREKFRWG